MQVDIYHTTTKPLEAIVPKLLERCLKEKWRCGIFASDAKTSAWWDEYLWTTNESPFLPHAVIKDGMETRKEIPILITTSEESMVDRDIILTLPKTQALEQTHYKRCIIPIDESQGVQEWGRELWKHYKTTNHQRRYFKTTPMGQWQQKE